ncbi:MAG: hypothetical protein IJ678_05265 [Kiritimatiellae bacterium]|nr:hypothetical protein [Kiritimatiellia bacterium]
MKNRSRILDSRALASAAAFAAAALAAAPSSAATRNLVWANKGSAMSDAANWLLEDAATPAETAPTAEDRLFFSGTPVVQPRLDQTMQIGGLRFGPAGTQARDVDDSDGKDPYDNSGWRITGEPGATLDFPKNWNEGKNWNFAISQSTLGTNTVEVPVLFSSTSTGTWGMRPVLVFGGRLELLGPVASAVPGATLLASGNSRSGTLALGPANPALPETVRLDAGIALELPAAASLGPVTKIELNQSAGSSNRQALRNASGGALELPNVTSITSTAKNENCHFEGDGPMLFPNAAFEPRLDDSREFYIDVPTVVKTLGNAYAGTGQYAFRKRGAAVLRVTDDVFAGAPEGQENRIDMVAGALVLENDAYLARDYLLFGINGYFFETDGDRPVLGLLHDYALPEGGAVPGGFVSYGDRARNIGFAAFGGDRTVTPEGGSYKLLDTADASDKLPDVAAHGAGNSGWWKRAQRLVFGAPEADGTVTFAGDVDVNVAQASWSVNGRTFWAVAGEAPVAGRIEGCITNTGAAGLTGSRMYKEGDGVLALDGRCELLSANPSFVYEGGLLVNGSAAGPFSVTNRSGSATAPWIGGTGRLESTVTVWAGGALRPGDGLGRGTLEISGSLVVKDGGRIVINADASSNSAIRFTGSGCDYRAEGAVVMEIAAAEGLEKGRTIKIFDWSEAANPSYLTMTDASRYRFELPEDSPLHHPSVFKDGEALYLKFSVDTGRPFKVLFD